MKDVFLCHAHHDKADYVIPMAEALDHRRISYWLDAAEIKWGDSVALKINQGLRTSRHVLVFLSGHFVKRRWPNAELGAAISKRNTGGKAKLLPLILGDPAAIFDAYPLIRDLRCTFWADGVHAIAETLDALLVGAYTLRELESLLRRCFRKNDFEQLNSSEYVITKYCEDGWELFRYYLWDPEKGALTKWWSERSSWQDITNRGFSRDELVRLKKVLTAKGYSI